MASPDPGPVRHGRALDVVLRLLAAAGLAVDAAVHARLAGQYDAVTATISQGTLFRVEAAAASLAVLLVLLWRHRIGDAFAWLTAAAGLAAILLYRYVDVGALGPLPNMYEPIWSHDKTTSAWAQAVAVAALTVLLIRHGRWRGPGRTSASGPA
ncbi:hypothetical protein [Streptomyces sp. CB01881]|uniref:hypothetical protein n=1 Tax=Streptomyces sp. CB01881 TaxID=2078691 RepID=UPI000CDBD6B7|nr:hypothetical protein [Streptomyces sp. CB01881]AUY47651.1 hypothetical protein C2142_00195 [Streptomyces sp. CB01881]TYC76124.1 hypothetical protein EH183_00195 [Streptomyces sp. CB01881]